MDKTNLVIITCGQKSLHQFWEQDHKADSNFDLALLIYDDSSYNDINSANAKYIQKNKGIKFKLFNQFLKENPNVINEYEYFLLFDDDLLCTVDDLSQFFNIIKEHNFDLSQPSLTQDSYYSHIPTVKHDNSYYRLTNYVEIMCPAFSQRFLKEVMPIFDEMEFGIGWGLEQYWFEFLENYKGISKYLGKVGVIDAVSVKHTKPAMSGTFYKDIDFGKEMTYIISKCDTEKYIWGGKEIVSYDNGFKTLQTYQTEYDKKVLYDTLPDTAYTSVGTITSEESIQNLDIILNANKEILSLFPYIIVAQNRTQNISDELYEQSKQIWKKYFKDVIILDYDINRGHCFGAADLDNTVVEYAKTLPIKHIWKSANDIYFTHNVLGNDFNEDIQIYYLQGIGVGGVVNNYKDVEECITKSYESIDDMFPQTNFYIITKDVDFINDKKYIDESYEKCKNIPEFNGRVWEYIPGLSNEVLLKECVVRNNLKFKHILDYETYNKLVQTIMAYNIHDCSHKNVLLSKQGICHFHNINDYSLEV